MDVCVLDRADAESCLQLLESARNVGRRVPVVAVVARNQTRRADQLIAAGAADVLVATGLDEFRFERDLRNAYDRARTEEALRASWRRFRALTANSVEGVIVLDAAAKVRYANDAVRRVMGYWPHELIGEYLFDHAHPDDAGQARQLFDDSVSAGHPVGGTFQVEHQDGQWGRLEWVMASYLEDPDVRGVVATCRDVTDRYRAYNRCAA
jgi:PAS domain S-box-containing protein